MKDSASLPAPTVQRLRAQILALVLILGCLYLLFQTAQVPMLTCSHRPAGTDCTVKNTLFGLIPLQQIEFTNLQAARVGQSCERGGCSYRMELAHSGGSTPFRAAYTPEHAGADEQVRQVERFLQDASAAPLALWQTSGIMEIGLPLVGLAAGFFILLARPRSPRAAPVSSATQTNAQTQENL